MKIFADENIPLMTVEALRALGHDVLDIRGTVDEGMPDDNIWEKAQREKRMLITTDKGFADCRDQQHCGILVIRLRQPNRHKIHKRVMQAMAQFKEEEWSELLVIMRDTAQSVWRASRREYGQAG